MNTHHPEAQADHKGMYTRFTIMVLLSFLAMYGLMYAMVDSLSNVFGSINRRTWQV